MDNHSDIQSQRLGGQKKSTNIYLQIRGVHGQYVRPEKEVNFVSQDNKNRKKWEEQEW